LYGVNPGPHHLTSLLLHIANTLLLFYAFSRMSGAVGRSAFAAGLFAAHPLHVQSVACIAERKDVLSTVFGLMAICAYAAYVEQPRFKRYAAVVAFFALGLMEKPMLVTLPFILLLLDFWPLHRTAARDWDAWLRLVREKIPLFVVAALSGAVTVIAQQRGQAVASLGALPIASRMANAAIAYVDYIGQMLWPTRLAIFYPYSEVVVSWMAAALALTAASILAARAAVRRPYLPVGWFWDLGTLIPVIGLVQVGGQGMADRYTYVPSIGLFIVGAWGLAELAAKFAVHPRGLAVSGAVVLGVCAFRANREVLNWRDGVAVWRHALDVTSNNPVAEWNLGWLLAGQGEDEQAVGHFAEAQRLAPEESGIHRDFGFVLATMGKLDDAVAQYSEALRIAPESADLHFGLAAVLAQKGSTDEAVRHYREALKIRPGHMESLMNLSVALANMGKFEEALPYFAEIAQITPGSAEAHNNLGSALASVGRLEDAMVQFSAALRARPGYADAQNNLAAVHHRIGLAHRQEGRRIDAEREFTEALRLNPDHQDSREALDDVGRGGPATR
jgi:tetratricopeptide (TPR) repeat protein